MFVVYVLKSVARNYLYVGLTGNFKKRFNQHQLGQNKTTKPYLPFEIVLLQNFPTRLEARAREKYLKSGSGKEYLRSLIR